MIINLTQHPATPEQVEAGVKELPPELAKEVRDLLTFNALPSRYELEERAKTIAAIAASTGCRSAMIGGAPFFMEPLARRLIYAAVHPLYAFSVRESREVRTERGVEKVSVFRHLGFVGDQI